ncbi:MAG: hypothetical protein QOE46_1252 [Acidobacteriota bacterium]|nr:hypothetical protein [Acidobacteriota bacterium]
MTTESAEELWYSPTLDVFLNHWFSSYAEARAARESMGGFLLPYRRHFFVCEAGVISALGLEPEDADWERVGWDCARPADAAAYGRLREKRERVLRGSQG